MISQQTALNTPTRTFATGTPRPVFARAHFTAIGTSLARLTHALQAWASAPALPYAALWEASVVVDLLGDQNLYEPDPLATERPYLTDAWLRG
jgi:hypothetical protein